MQTRKSDGQRHEIVYEALISAQDTEGDDWLNRQMGRGPEPRPVEAVSTQDVPRLTSEAVNLVGQLEQSLMYELPQRLERAYDLHADVQIRYIGEGSILIVFGVILSGFELVTQYQDFYESVQLIRSHAQRLLDSVLRRVGRPNGVSVQVSVQRVPQSGGHPAMSALPRRDAFFWLLLVLCIVQFVFILSIVAGAVVKTYY